MNCELILVHFLQHAHWCILEPSPPYSRFAPVAHYSRFCNLTPRLLTGSKHNLCSNFTRSSRYKPSARKARSAASRRRAGLHLSRPCVAPRERGEHARVPRYRSGKSQFAHNARSSRYHTHPPTWSTAAAWRAQTALAERVWLWTGSRSCTATSGFCFWCRLEDQRRAEF